MKDLEVVGYILPKIRKHMVAGQCRERAELRAMFHTKKPKKILCAVGLNNRTLITEAANS